MVSYISYILMYIISVFDADMCNERMLTVITLMILRQRHRDLWVQQGSWIQILQFPSTHRIENTAGANPTRRMASLNYLFIYLWFC
jgi:hypothetical protein